AEARVTQLKTAGLLKETDGHLQGTHPASIYCWLYAPMLNYYFFTNNIVESCSQQLTERTVNGKKAIFLKNTYSFMSEVKNTLRERNFPHTSETELSAITCDFVDYVGMQILEAKKQTDTKDRYWLLVSKPSIWSFNEINVGEIVEYTLFNEAGNKRRVFENFGKAKKGEPIICYESSPTGAVVALAEISEKSNGQSIFIRKTKAVDTPLSLDDLLKHPETQDRFSKIQGSLFEMSKLQYDTVVHLIDGSVEASVWPSKRNLIRFGAPGTGKSHLMNQEAEKYFSPEHTERVTFHPEYTSFDFIGAYKPTVRYAGTKDERVSYGFVPGPFARVLKSARTATTKPHLLIIEEINRANAAAVFADTFQLLDRNENGESKYSIGVSEEFAAYLGMKAGEKLVLPKNMYIWATMNSADQGVFPIDTAFKRRWHFTYCGIDDARDALLKNGSFAEKWNHIREHANKLLQNAGVQEDKQMGPFFLSGEELEHEADFIEAICNKVLMYLYEDAAKHKRSSLFKDANKRYSELCSLFKSKYGEDIADAIEEILLPQP
ncbi:MAG: AAA family ATPase, partial [Akkermansia sp.]|nr:AAA family ATPase [Akkermansia sp.]